MRFIVAALLLAAVAVAAQTATPATPSATTVTPPTPAAAVASNAQYVHTMQGLTGSLAPMEVRARPYGTPRRNYTTQPLNLKQPIVIKDPETLQYKTRGNFSVNPTIQNDTQVTTFYINECCRRGDPCCNRVTVANLSTEDRLPVAAEMREPIPDWRDNWIASRRAERIAAAQKAWSEFNVQNTVQNATLQAQIDYRRAIRQAVRAARLLRDPSLPRISPLLTHPLQPEVAPTPLPPVSHYVQTEHPVDGTPVYTPVYNAPKRNFYTPHYPATWVAPRKEN